MKVERGGFASLHHARFYFETAGAGRALVLVHASIRGAQRGSRLKAQRSFRAWSARQNSIDTSSHFLSVW